jgi:replicative DNA helicase
MHNELETPLPECTKAEMSLIGSLIVRPDYADEARQFVKGSDFGSTRNGIIYDAIQQIVTSNVRQTGKAECDDVQLLTYLQTKGMLEQCGGEAYLIELTSLATEENWKFSARSIRNTARVRRLIDLCDRVKHKATLGQFATTDQAESFLSRAAKAFAEATAPMIEPDRISRAGDEVVATRLEKIVSGDINTVGTPWPEVDHLIQPFLPGSIVLLSGAPGSAKSFMALQIVSHIITNGIHADILTLESGREYHLTRRLAQVSGEPRLTQIDWVATNGERAMAIQEQHAEHLALVGQHVYEAPDISYRGVVDWALTRMKAGARVVCIDPITMASGEGKPWEEDKRLMSELSAAAKEYRCSILLVTHPKTQTASDRKAAPHQSDMAGGAAYARFSTASFTLVRHENPKTILTDKQERHDVTHYLFIGKARDGSGSGKFGFVFDKDTLSFKLGALVKQEIADVMEKDQW